MKQFFPIVLVILFVSCNSIHSVKKNTIENINIDGEYHGLSPWGTIGSLPYFIITKDQFFYVTAINFKCQPPIEGKITKTPDGGYLFQSKFLDPRFNYEKHSVANLTDSVILDLHILFCFEEIPTVGSDLVAILDNGEQVTLIEEDSIIKPVCVSTDFANKIDSFWSFYYGRWSVKDHISTFEGGNKYTVFLFEYSYFNFVINEKFRINGDTLFWPMKMDSIETDDGRLVYDTIIDVLYIKDN